MIELPAPATGFVAHCDARTIGEVVRDLGGGRLTKETIINPDVGIDQLAAPGERVNLGAILCRVHAATQDQAEAALIRLRSAFEISETRQTPAPLIESVIET